MSSLLQRENTYECTEQELASLSDEPDALSLLTIIEKQVGDGASLSAESRKTEIFRTWRRKESQEAGD